MKNLFFGAVTVEEKPWNQSTEHSWPMEFQAWPSKASFLDILMSNVWWLTKGCLANHVNDISDTVDPIAPSAEHYVDWKGEDKQLTISEPGFHIFGDQK